MAYIFYVECTSSYSVYIREVNLKNVSISHQNDQAFCLDNRQKCLYVKYVLPFSMPSDIFFFICKICLSFSMQSDISFIQMQHASFFFHAVRISFFFFQMQNMSFFFYVIGYISFFLMQNMSFFFHAIGYIFISNETFFFKNGFSNACMQFQRFNSRRLSDLQFVLFLN